MEKIVSLREKASRDELIPADIEGITLGNLFRSLHQNDDSWDDDELDDEDREYEEREYIETLNHFFKALDGVQTLDPDEECLYAIDDDGSIQFFSEETQVKKAFADSIAVSVTPWETYSDSELEDWLEDIEKIIRDREGFPFTFFD